MANVDGDFADRGYAGVSGSGAVAANAAYATGSGTVGSFVMRGWNTSVSEWRSWISYGSPDPNPPAGYGPVVGVTIVASWE